MRLIIVTIEFRDKVTNEIFSFSVSCSGKSAQKLNSILKEKDAEYRIKSIKVINPKNL